MTRRSRRSRTSTACASRPPIRSRRGACSAERGVTSSSSRSPARSRRRRGWGSRTRSSTSSRPARRWARTACGGSAMLLESQAVLVGGRGAVDERRELVERLELMLSGVVAARRRRYVMMNATVDDAPGDSRRAARAWARRRCCQLADEGEIAVHAAVDAGDIWSLLPGSRRRGRDVDPRPPDREARPVRGAGWTTRSPWSAPIVADVRERGDAALLEWTERFDGPRPDGFRVPAERIAEASVDADVLEALRAMIAAVRVVQRGAAAGGHDRRGGAGHRLRAALAADRRRRGLRAERPRPAAVVARDDRRPGAGRRRAADRGRDADARSTRRSSSRGSSGSSEIYAVGGAQAVAALAYGTETIAAGGQDRRPGERAT